MGISKIAMPLASRGKDHHAFRVPLAYVPMQSLPARKSCELTLDPMSSYMQIRMMRPLVLGA